MPQRRSPHRPTVERRVTFGYRANGGVGLRLGAIAITAAMSTSIIQCSSRLGLSRPNGLDVGHTTGSRIRWRSRSQVPQ